MYVGLIFFKKNKQKTMKTVSVRWAMSLVCGKFQLIVATGGHGVIAISSVQILWES